MASSLTVASAAGCAFALLPALALAAPALPELDPAGGFECVVAPDGRRVRLQCVGRGDAGGGRCLYVVECDDHADDDTCRAYERADGCASAEQDGATWARRAADGYTFVEARLGAEPGWYRDDRGRVLQVDFDLNQRVFLGARWLGRVGPGGAVELGAVGLETGMRFELFEDVDARYRLRVLETETQLNPFAFRGRLLRYDSSARDADPLLRITTFWPEPARHDVFLDIGAWVDLLAVVHRPRQSVDETHLRYAAVGASWDLWTSDDMSSYLRLRSGVALDHLFLRGAAERAEGSLMTTPVVRLEGDFTLDGLGHHHLSFDAGYEALLLVGRAAGDVARDDVNHRATASLAYEVIVLAVNDQPVTLRAALEGGWRDDFVAAYDGWDLRVGAGLRLSLLAPPRDHEAAAEGAAYAAKRRQR